MPVLPNPRHERFAQERANGQTIDKSYEIAGYTPNRGNASTLNGDQNISKRVTEILAQRERKAAKALEKAIDILAISRADVFRMIAADRDLARQLGQTATAVTAAKLLGQELHGMFIDRKHITHTNASASEMPFEELLAIAQGRVIEHQATDVEAAPDTPDDDDKIQP